MYGAPHATGSENPAAALPLRLQHRPDARVVPRVFERVMTAALLSWQRGRPEALPFLPEVAGEPRQRPRQFRHGPPQLADHNVVVVAVPRPRLRVVAVLGQERQQLLADRRPRPPGRVAR